MIWRGVVILAGRDTKRDEEGYVSRSYQDMWALTLVFGIGDAEARSWPTASLSLLKLRATATSSSLVHGPFGSILDR